MTNHLSLFFCALIVGCVSKTTDTTKKDAPAADSISYNPSIIYDTIALTDNMKGETLDEKYASGREELSFYRKFIIDKKINELVVLQRKDVKNEIRYLGTITNLDNKTSYHVITNFRIIGIGTMLSPRGRSDVAFVNEAKDKIIVYNLPMPENLPKDIRNNMLFFEYDSVKAGISIAGGLPPLLCLPKIGCN